MKKIILFIIAGFMFILGACSSRNTSNEFDTFDKAVSNLDSYSLTANMTIYKFDKEINADIKVDYLKPDFYKVVFKTQNSNEQIIVKNKEGVFVITPSINKQFKFDSEWPLNSSHAYLIDAVWKDIKKDSNLEYKVNGNILSIEATISDSKISKIKMDIDIKNNKPLTAEFYDSNNDKRIYVVFKEFKVNPKLSEDIFNQNIILNEQTEGNVSTELELSVTVGYVCEGTRLVSKKLDTESVIMVYEGEFNYTIIINKLDDNNSLIQAATELDILESGLVLYNKNVTRYYIQDVEVSIYSKSLDLDTVCNILSQLVIC